MAHKTPTESYRRTHYISLHAVEELRKRLGEKHRYSSFDNHDLSNALDEAVNLGLKKDNIEKFDHEGKPNLGVDISDFFRCSLRAVVAKNLKKGSPFNTAVVTILNSDVPLKQDKTTIGDAISPEVKAALRASVEGRTEEADPVDVDKKPSISFPVVATATSSSTSAPTKAPVRSVVEAKPTKISTRDVSVDRRLISYVKEGETTLVVEEFPTPGDLRNRIFDLHQKGRKLEDITVWKPSKVSIAIALDFEEG